VGLELKRVALGALMLLIASRALRADPPARSHKSSGKIAQGVVSLDVYAESPARLHLLTAERMASGAVPELRYVRSDDGGETWTAPVAVGVGQSPPEPVKRGNDAQIVAAGNHLFAVWTSGAATKMGRGPLVASMSRDGGRTWTPAPSPSDAKGIVDHAFADLAADEHGHFHAVWLDAREGEGTGKGLRYARSTDGGATWSTNLTIDAQCCECCWNRLLVMPGGRVSVLYREHDPRDMALLRSSNSGKTWTQPVTVGAFGWNVTACPHVGGALVPSDSSGRALSAVVWTAKGSGMLGVYALTSTDAGSSWKSPIRLGGAQANRPDLAARGSKLVAVWDEYLELPDASGNFACAAVSTDQGKTWSASRQLSAVGPSASHPRVVAVNDEFRVFWTEQSAGKPVKWVSRKVD
jgi:photosystem II stability/assembly factor-like uncharacterized protein